MADDLQCPGGRKGTAATTTTALRSTPREQALKCPRCDSPNTKFCYYNNYSLSQPRHFCKACRRYWTKGGALRNVPLGGGSRKNKKSKSSPSSSSRLPVDIPISRFPETSSGGLRFLDGVLPSSMAIDFHIGLPATTSRLHAPVASGVLLNSNQFIDFVDVSGNAMSPLVGVSYPISAAGVYNEIGGTSTSTANSSSIVSSIESLSSINQDLHWKLQQQRLAMLFGGEAHKSSTVSDLPPRPDLENPSSEVAEVCGGTGSGNIRVSTGINSSTSWFLNESSYTVPTSTTMTSNGSSNANNNSSLKGSSNTSISYWNNGIPAWNDMAQFSALP